MTYFEKITSTQLLLCIFESLTIPEPRTAHTKTVQLAKHRGGVSHSVPAGVVSTYVMGFEADGAKLWVRRVTGL